MSKVKTYIKYRKAWVGKGVDYDGVYGMQCVDLVKHFVREFYGVSLGSFSGSAIEGWKTGSPFNPKWKKIVYKPGRIPQMGDVVFFDATPKMPYGHVAIAIVGTARRLAVLEQNAKKGSGTGKDGDEIREDIITYKTPMQVLGWYKYMG